MHDAQVPQECATKGARKALDWDSVRKRCRERGAKTNAEAAQLMGMSPRSLNRLRNGSPGTRLGVVLNAAERIDMGLDEMFRPTAGDKRPTRRAA